MKSHVTKIHKIKTEPVKHILSEQKSETDSTESESDKSFLSCDQCSFKTVNKSKLKKHKKKPIRILRLKRNHNLLTACQRTFLMRYLIKSMI